MPRHRPYVFDDSDRPPDDYFTQLIEIRPKRVVWVCRDCSALARRSFGGRNTAFSDYQEHYARYHPELLPLGGAR